MSNENITIQDCLDNFLYKGKRVILKKGQVVDFEKEDKARIIKKPNKWTAIQVEQN